MATVIVHGVVAKAGPQVNVASRVQSDGVGVAW